MLHTKSPGHQPSGSGEEDFKAVLPYMGMSAILVMDLKKCEMLGLLIIRSLYMKFKFNWPHGF